MNPKLKEKIRESLSAVLPITAIGKKCGIHSEARGIVVSLPLEMSVGLGEEG